MDDEQVSRLLEEVLNEKLAPLLHKIDNLVAKCAVLEDKYDDLLIRHNELKEKFDEKVSLNVKEIEQRLLKAGNIVMSGVEESQSGNVEERRSRDIEKCAEILELIGIRDTQTAVKKVSRIGKPRPGYKRLLRIEFNDTSLKWLALREAKRLRKSRWKDVFINPDRTILQLEEERKLRTELAKRKISGEDVFISRGKIVPRNPDSNQSLFR